MADEPTLLDQIDIIARDFDASVEFYRTLGVDSPYGALVDRSTAATPRSPRPATRVARCRMTPSGALAMRSSPIPTATTSAS